eukprot:m.107614 g.107614  ORF g.107614 m.107614 type:complete len:330 (-) comp51705_c0_seq1:72-1061(-)
MGLLHSKRQDAHEDRKGPPSQATPPVRRARLHADSVVALCSSTAGCILTGSQDATLREVDVGTRSCVRTWQDHTRAITQVGYGERIQGVLSASRDASVRLRTPQTSVVFEGHQMAVTAAAFNDENDRVVSGSRDGRIRMWDISGKHLAEAVTPQNVVTQIRWISGSQTFLQSSEDKQLRVWDARTLKPAVVFPIENYIHTSCAVHADGNLFATTSNGFSGSGCHVSTWDQRAKKRLHLLQGHSEAVQACSFLPGSLRLATTGNDSSVRIWDVQTSGSCTAAFLSATTRFSSILPHPTDPQRLLAGGADGGLHEFLVADEGSALRLEGSF